ncbi:hypothetical protein [Novosphingobium meiothermophilum]|uniref:hypothetical protein n=1 Tax=Novosphingobium meiothermophilum TaxID=2202251 RepID=UPI000D6DCB1B|nr:hypothetical protein [Novosphingobium meiothermophilum]
MTLAPLSGTIWTAYATDGESTIWSETFRALNQDEADQYAVALLAEAWGLVPPSNPAAFKRRYLLSVDPNAKLDAIDEFLDDLALYPALSEQVAKLKSRLTTA